MDSDRVLVCLGHSIGGGIWGKVVQLSFFLQILLSFRQNEHAVIS